VLPLESGKCDGAIGTELVISLLAARNVMGNVLILVPLHSRGQRDLSGARGSGRLAKTGRRSGMALEVQ
jgi:hypothetical protein